MARADRGDRPDIGPSQAIELIVEQGEGARGDWIKSHFGKFVGILEDLLDVRLPIRRSIRPGRSTRPTSGCRLTASRER